MVAVCSDLWKFLKHFWFNLNFSNTIFRHLHCSEAQILLLNGSKSGSTAANALLTVPNSCWWKWPLSQARICSEWSRQGPSSSGRYLVCKWPKANSKNGGILSKQKLSCRSSSCLFQRGRFWGWKEKLPGVKSERANLINYHGFVGLGTKVMRGEVHLMGLDFYGVCISERVNLP